MNDAPKLDSEELIRRIGRDLADGYDEEFEMEIEDRPKVPGLPADSGADADSTRLQSSGPAGAQRSRAHAVVFPTLRTAPSGGRGDRFIRPQLVQPN